MKKPYSQILILALTLFILAMFAGCNSQNNSKVTFISSCSSELNSTDTFGLEQFQSEMRARGYNFEMQDAESNIFPTTKKRMNIGKDSINVYIFSSNEEMENEAKCLSKDGGTYRKGNDGMCIDWAFFPLFYKKGTIIVQYGDTEEGRKIVSDLNDIFGEHFAGGKQ